MYAEPAKLQGENWGSGGLASSGGPGGSGPSGGIKGGRRPPLTKKGHILVLKKALKINFSVFSAAVRSLVAPPLYIELLTGSPWPLTTVPGIVRNTHESPEQFSQAQFQPDTRIRARNTALAPTRLTRRHPICWMPDQH